MKFFKVKNSDEKYRKGLLRSNRSLFGKIKILFVKNRKIDEDFFNNLEEIFLESDLGPKLTDELLNQIKKEVKKNKIIDVSELQKLVFNQLYISYANSFKNNVNLNLNPKGLTVILVIGVNGTGKTTTIAKLAKYFSDQNLKVAVAAADTFRAAAVEQLQIWSERLNIPCISNSDGKGDPASVVYKAITYCNNNKSDILICDTAGRLENKKNLLNELSKINKIIVKLHGSNPEETFLTIDATTGQNGIHQAENFSTVSDLTGIVLTKMDGSSKGGIVFSIKNKLNLPVKFIGVGESLGDLLPFDLDVYLNRLIDMKDN